MVTTPGAAAGAYQALARLNQGLGNSDLIGNNNKPTGVDFGNLVRESLQAVARQGHEAEAQTRAFANGKADLVNVVTAVAESQTAMETLIAVRDRVINAYEEILRLPI